MADANRTNLRYDVEATWGVITETPKFIETRFTSESFKGTKSTETSNEIRDDRQVPDVIRTGKGASGDLGFELSYASYDDFLLALLQAASWSAVKTNTDTTYSAAAVDNSFNDSSSQFLIDGFVANQWIEVRGFTGASTTANGYFKIVSVVAGKMVVSGGTLIDDAAGESVTITMGAQITNATTETSITFEREQEDVSNTFSNFTGMEPTSLSLNIPTSGVITGTFSFMGEEESATAATVGDGAPTAANTNQVMSSANHVVNALVDQAAASVVSGSIEISNAMRDTRKVGTLAPAEIGQGRFQASVNLVLVFSGNTNKSKVLAHTDFSTAIIFEDTAGNAYIIDFPACASTGEDSNATGVDTDIDETLSLEAKMHASEAITCRIARFAA